jgi:hypothetical protein
MTHPEKANFRRERFQAYAPPPFIVPFLTVIDLGTVRVALGCRFREESPTVLDGS